MIFILLISCIIVLLVLYLTVGYLKAPPDTAFIISGLGKRRILIGKAGWRIPFRTEAHCEFEVVDLLPAGS